MYSRLQYTVRKKFSVFYGYALEFQLTLSRRLPVLGHQYPPEVPVSFFYRNCYPTFSFLSLLALSRPIVPSGKTIIASSGLGWSSGSEFDELRSFEEQLI